MNIVITPKFNRAVRSLAHNAGWNYRSLQNLRDDVLVDPFTLTLNWGCYRDVLPRRQDTVNRRAARNKLEVFEQWAEDEVPTVQWTTDKGQAEQWPRVIVRYDIRGTRGSGIEYWDAELGGPLPIAPLYTKYIRDRREYRLHFHLDEGQFTYLLQQKRRRNGVEHNDVVRNYHGGWIYCVNNVTPLPEGGQEILRTAAYSLHDRWRLSFGALDFITQNGHIYMLEYNSAPALRSVTVMDFYRKMLEGMK